MIVILCLIILFLSSVILFLTIKILQQKKLILSYDKCSKLNGNMQRLMFLANLAKTKGHDVEIDYSTIYGCYYVTLYKKSWGNCWDRTYATQITNDEELKKIIKELERLIK